MADLTVLMPVYNREEYVQEAVESILSQTYKDFELLIYDDGSTDKTVSILEALAKKDDRICLLKGDVNKGGLYAKQMLLNWCTTEIACFQDSDDISEPKRLEEQLALMSHGAVFCNWCYLDYMHERWLKIAPRTKNLAIISMMFKVDKNIKMDTTRMWGSLEWFNRMKERYPEWTTAPDVLYCVRKHPGRITEIKVKLDRLIKKGKVKEEDFIHLSYPELIKFVTPLFKRYKV